MNAVVLKEYGGPEQLHYEEVPTPQPGEGEVLVRVISTSVNPVDYKIRSGEMQKMMPLELPAILGRDVAGEVVGLGKGVSEFQPGDLVMGLVNKSYAEFLTAKASDLAKIPQGLNPEDAGVLPLVVETGAQLVEIAVQPKAGETVLVTGAAGSVGRTAVFVLKQHGAKVIAGVKKAQMDQAREIGADQMVALDDDAAIGKLGEVDAIADTVAGATLQKLLPKLKKGGRIASVLGKPEGTDGIDVRVVMAKPDPKRLHELAHKVRDGELNIPIAKRMRLSEIQEAQQVAEKGAQGKIALRP